MKILWIITCIAMSMVVHAGEITPLKNCDARGGYIYYHENSLAVQAARFDLPAPGLLRTITVMLGGARGTVRLHVFGGEGGLGAPLLEHDLADPILVDKAKAGIERITITLAAPLRFNTSQLFIAFDNLSAGVTLLSDHRRKKPACRSTSDTYYYQLIKDGDNWRWGTYGYAVELGFEFDRSIPEPTFSNVTRELKLPDSALLNNGIAWADINGDGYLDLLAGGHLFRNNGGNEFTDITTAAGISGHPVMQAFFDADNDASPDLLALEASDSGMTGVLYINSGGTVFTRKEIALTGVNNPNCFSIADIDRDGRLDLFIGGGTDSLGRFRANNLFLNQGGGQFLRDTVLLRSGESANATIASQWVDYNNDGYLDLFTVDAGGIGTIWKNNEGKELIPTKEPAGVSLNYNIGVRGTGCGWADYNNDGMMDLLLPGPAAVRPAHNSSSPMLAQLRLNSGGPDFTFAKFDNLVTPEYLEERSGGAAADIDNDGLLDAILTTSCTCSYVDLYRQTSAGHFEERTFNAGLWRVAGGPDAVWADYNNDGALDLAMMRDGRITLYKNNSANNQNNFVDFDLDDRSGNHSAIGARVMVYSGDNRYTQEVTAGRGRAMQDPLRLHFGIGTASRVDSVTVRWPNSSYTESFTGIALDRDNILKSGRASGPIAKASLQLYAAPNPFAEKLTFTYTVPYAMRVRLDIYSSSGELVATLLDDEVEAGDHTLFWEAKDRSGIRLPQGTYIYRLTSPTGELVGKAVLRL